MIEIEVLGSGCTKCIETAERVQTAADDLGVAVHIVKESNPEVIMKYGVMQTPAVAVDGKLQHSGSVPSQTLIEGWLK